MDEVIDEVVMLLKFKAHKEGTRLIFKQTKLLAMKFDTEIVTHKKRIV